MWAFGLLDVHEPEQNAVAAITRIVLFQYLWCDWNDGALGQGALEGQVKPAQ